MNPSRHPLLAIQVDGIEFALEPGRTYALGGHPHCDLRLSATDAAPIAVRVSLGDGVAVLKPTAGRAHHLAIGDSMRIGATELRVVVDHGNAVLLPDPAMRAARQAEKPAAAGMAAPPTSALSSTAADGGRGAATTTFAQLMAHELRRAPWVGLSLLLHALVLLLLLWLFPPVPEGSATHAIYGFDGHLGVADPPRPTAGPPQVVVEPADPVLPTLNELSTPADAADGAVAEAPAPAWGDRSLLRIGGERVASGRRTAGGDGDVLDGGGGAGSGAFRATVTELRRTGLEVVFVIDSTGSMGHSIAAAKEGISTMLEVLRALVPDARFGLVAYRDRGQGEDYLLRVLPLERDFYAAVNFVQSIHADGGGDVPEAVLDGLRAAFKQPFRPGARRVVVLAGDAPPHPAELRPLLDEVQQFVRAGKSFVHTLITNPGRGGANAADSFRGIAERGRGICTGVDDHSRILKEVLSLAFGRQFAGNLEAVRAQLEAARRSPPTWALQLARSGGPELRRALAAETVPATLVHALLRLPRRGVACELADLLGGDQLSASGRQAAAHVLQRQLQLERVPIDPERPRVIPKHVVAELRELAQKLPE